MTLPEAALPPEPADVGDLLGSAARPTEERRANKKKRTKAGSRLVLWVALGGVALVALLGCGGVGVWALFFRKDPSVGPGGWAKFQHADGVFTAAFPGGRPEYESVGSKPPNMNLPGGKNLKDMILKIEAWVREEKGREYAVVLVTVPANPVPGQVQGSMNDVLLTGAKSVEARPVEANGWRGERRVLRTASQTLDAHVDPLAGKYMLKVTVKGDEKLDPDDPQVAEFFERTKPNPDRK